MLIIGTIPTRSCARQHETKPVEGEPAPTDASRHSASDGLPCAREKEQGEFTPPTLTRLNPAKNARSLRGGAHFSRTLSGEPDASPSRRRLDRSGARLTRGSTNLRARMGGALSGGTANTAWIGDGSLATRRIERRAGCLLVRDKLVALGDAVRASATDPVLPGADVVILVIAIPAEMTLSGPGGESVLEEKDQQQAKAGDG